MLPNSDPPFFHLIKDFQETRKVSLNGRTYIAIAENQSGWFVLQFQPLPGIEPKRAIQIAVDAGLNGYSKDRIGELKTVGYYYEIHPNGVVDLAALYATPQSIIEVTEGAVYGKRRSRAN